MAYAAPATADANRGPVLSPVPAGTAVDAYAPEIGPEVVFDGPDPAGPEACGSCAANCCPGEYDLQCDLLAPLQGRVTGRVEYLVWWLKGDPTPPLVTTSPDSTPQDQAGALGQDSTEILFGGEALNNRAMSGLRATVDLWCCPCQCCGIEAGFLWVGPKTTTFDATSNGSPILARPYVNSANGMQEANLIAYPGWDKGSIHVAARSELIGADILFRKALFSQDASRFDVLVGYRFLRLSDSLGINDSSTVTSAEGPHAVGTVTATSDLFDVRNEFNGVELGFIHGARLGAWSLDLSTKLALGATRSRTSISGSTTVTVPTVAPATFPGGILAEPTNIGERSHSEFAVVPEVGVTLGCDLAARWRFTMSYTFLYWSTLMRAGDQIDRTLNPTQFSGGQLSGAARPQPLFTTTDFWAQGLGLGLEYRF